MLRSEVCEGLIGQRVSVCVGFGQMRRGGGGGSAGQTGQVPGRCYVGMNEPT